MIADCRNPELRKERPDCAKVCKINGHAPRLCDCQLKIRYKPGFTIADCPSKERRLKRLQEQRETMQAHIAQLKDKIEIVEHEIRECTP